MATPTFQLFSFCPFRTIISPCRCRKRYEINFFTIPELFDIMTSIPFPQQAAKCGDQDETQRNQPSQEAHKMDVYHNGNFLNTRFAGTVRQRGRLTALPVHQTFLWESQELFIPALYAGKAGTVLDVCVKIPL